MLKYEEEGLYNRMIKIHTLTRDTQDFHMTKKICEQTSKEPYILATFSHFCYPDTVKYENTF